MTMNSISDRERESKSTKAAESPPEEVLDRLAELLPTDVLEDALKGLSPEEITGPGGFLNRLAGRVVETALGVELEEHLGHPPGGVPASANVRNGATAKTVQTDLGPVQIKTPRDREGSFEPRLVAKRQTRLAGLDEKVIALYAGGMTVRDISEHLSEIYGTQIGRDSISRITDAVLDDVGAWRTRPLDRVYPIVYFDAMMVKVREDRSVRQRACYLALGVTCDGDREVLGIWWQDTEGSKFWLAVLNDLKRRGVQDVLIACVDGLKGFPDAIEATYPQAWVQTCIVHLIRASLRYVNYKDQKKVASALRPIYTAANADDALAELERFEHEWGDALPRDRAGLARVMGTRHAVPLAARRAAQGRLHHQHHRGPAPPDPQGDQNPRALPRRAGRHQADLPGDHQGRRQVAAQPHLDSATRSPQDPFRRPIPRLTPPHVTTASHTEERTASAGRGRPERARRSCRSCTPAARGP